jgi:hypothetical protein
LLNFSLQQSKQQNELLVADIINLEKKLKTHLISDSSNYESEIADLKTVNQQITAQLSTCKLDLEKESKKIRNLEKERDRLIKSVESAQNLLDKVNEKNSSPSTGLPVVSPRDSTNTFPNKSFFPFPSGPPMGVSPLLTITSIDPRIQKQGVVQQTKKEMDSSNDIAVEGKKQKKVHFNSTVITDKK